ncbi:radical SAM protein [Methanocella conradii]|uniref:radical SAM protein n=1 Tax=Methanocella conradii TaxID=1175444 RepID=UPI0024B370A2|nr:radical SAM protein [Methanocella conradii]MDI6895829.1 radical SAM protein [Methanocella conradii]
MEVSVKKKAELIEAGGVVIDSSFRPYVTRATAGPGAGLESIFVNIDGHRVRLGVRQASRFKASLDGDDVTIYDDAEKVFVRGKLEEAISHCPRQAYITVSERCVFDCKFCPVPRLQGKVKSTEEVLELVRNGLKNPDLASISLTSGVWKTPEEEVERVAGLVREIYDLVKPRNIPIGVSVYPTDDSSEALKDAGALEIKYNVESVDPGIFKKVCPDLSQDYIVKSLGHAVSVFGRNHVFTNVLIGLGETDDTVIKGIEMLASMGVIPILRKVSPHPLRKDDVYIENVSAGRLLKLASEERRILAKYGLDVTQARTGCLPCTGCDVSPVRDI